MVDRGALDDAVETGGQGRKLSRLAEDGADRRPLRVGRLGERAEPRVEARHTVEQCVVLGWDRHRWRTRNERVPRRHVRLP